MIMNMIVFYAGIEKEIFEFLKKVEIKNYTMHDKVYGKGTASGPHFGSDVWPKINFSVYFTCEENQKSEIYKEFRILKEEHKKHGLKLFAWELSEVI